MENMICLFRFVFVIAFSSACAVRGADVGADLITNITQDIIVINASTTSFVAYIEQKCQLALGNSITYPAPAQRIDAGKFVTFNYNFLQSIIPKITAISNATLLFKLDQEHQNRYAANIFKFVKTNPVVIISNHVDGVFACVGVKPATVVNSLNYRHPYSEVYTCFTIKNLHDKPVTAFFKYKLFNNKTAPLKFEEWGKEQKATIAPQEHGLFYYCSAIYTLCEGDNEEKITTQAVNGSIVFTCEGKEGAQIRGFLVAPCEKMLVERYTLKTDENRFVLNHVS